MTIYDMLIGFCVLCVIAGILALVVRNETVSTRKSITQAVIIAIVTGGLIGIEGNAVVGTAVSVIGLVVYGVLRARYSALRQLYAEQGRKVPEKSKL